MSVESGQWVGRVHGPGSGGERVAACFEDARAWQPDVLLHGWDLGHLNAAQMAPLVTELARYSLGGSLPSSRTTAFRSGARSTMDGHEGRYPTPYLSGAVEAKRLLWKIFRSGAAPLGHASFVTGSSLSLTSFTACSSASMSASVLFPIASAIHSSIFCPRLTKNSANRSISNVCMSIP